MSTALELLDRQLAYLDGLADSEVLFAVGDFLAALAADPEIAPHLADLCREADALGAQYVDEEENRGKPGQLLEFIWDKLTSQLAPPQSDRLVEYSNEFQRLVGSFGHPAVLPLDPNRPASSLTRVSRLLEIIGELDVSGGKAIIDDSRGPFTEIEARQAKLYRKLLARTRNNPGVALLRLRCLASMVEGDGGATGEASSCPPPGREPHLKVTASHSWEGLIDQLIDGGDEALDQFTAAPAFVGSVRAAAERLALELRGRLGTTRSKQALIDRYKARCEWHDRVRLRELAAQAIGARENVLRDDLARYLFDQGLNPISEARIGEKSRADIFDAEPASAFYLEAKQYEKGTSVLTALRSAFTQALDTAAALSGSGYEAVEAFIVVFRLGGARAILPGDPIPFDGLRWYLRLINIAPPDGDASKNREAPQELKPEELLDLLTEARSKHSAK